MNWQHGFRRLSYGILLVAWIIGAIILSTEIRDLEQMKETLRGLVGFTVGWLLFHHLVAWVARGFTQPRG